jgi:hypothetical protein
LDWRLGLLLQRVGDGLSQTQFLGQGVMGIMMRLVHRRLRRRSSVGGIHGSWELRYRVVSFLGGLRSVVAISPTEINELRWIRYLLAGLVVGNKSEYVLLHITILKR